MVHELAHHVDPACLPDDVRASFRRVQGISADLSWDQGASWAEVPAEQFAEAMVEVVLGRRSPTLGVRIGPEAVELVGSLGSGRLTQSRSSNSITSCSSGMASAQARWAAT